MPQLHFEDFVPGSATPDGSLAVEREPMPAGAREAGKFRLEGKEYIVADGDVMHFRFNT